MKIIAKSDEEERVIENITKVQCMFCYNPIEDSMDFYRGDELVKSIPYGMLLNGMIIEIQE